jgi:hypothetical protein
MLCEQDNDPTDADGARQWIDALYRQNNLIFRGVSFAVEFRPAFSPGRLMVRFTAFVLSLAIFITPLTADAQGRGRGRGAGRFGALPLSGRVSEEPAFARGYADGFRHAQEDRREHRRYDPVGHRDYREADQGFSRSYGTLEAYRNNYRAGFRAGYDAGYRDDTSRRR